MAPILKHGPELHQGPCLWILAGTGEGPELAASLLQQGWRLRVSLVTRAAAQVYRPLLQRWSDERLQLLVGALEGPAGIADQLSRFGQQGERICAVIDATHPFATRISEDLRAVLDHRSLPLLRLSREPQAIAGAQLLPDLDALARIDLVGERLLLAVGSRRLGEAVARTPGALHHARVLPNPASLQLAMAAGLAPERVACLRPHPDFVVEQALLRQWQIGTILCRQSGGLTEAGWRRLAAGSGCRLLLLQRPREPAGVQQAGAELLPMAALLTRLEALLEALSHGIAQG